VKGVSLSRLLVASGLSGGASGGAGGGGRRRDALEAAPTGEGLLVSPGLAVACAASGGSIGVAPAHSPLYDSLASAGALARAGAGAGGGGASLPPVVAGNPFAAALFTRTYPLSAAAAGARLDALYLRGVARPRHAAAVHALTARFPAYGPAVRLAALWAGAQGIGPESSARGGEGCDSLAAEGGLRPVEGAGDAAGGAAVAHGEVAVRHGGAATRGVCAAQLPQELLELTVAAVFVAPEPYSPPATPAVAFARWLRLVATWDWAGEPLLVDLEGGAAAPSDARTLTSRFRAVRRLDTSGGGVAAGGAGTKRGRASEAAAPTPAAAASDPEGPAMYVVTPAERGAWRPLWASPTWATLGALRRTAAAADAVLTTVLAPVLPAVPAPAAAAAAGVRPPGGGGSGAAASALLHAPTSVSSLVVARTRPAGVTVAGAPLRAVPVWPMAFGAPATALYRAAASAGAGRSGADSATNEAVADACAGRADAALVLRGAILPRTARDGRAFGALKLPLEAAIAASAAPVAALARWHAATSVAGGGGARRVGGGGGSSGGALETLALRGAGADSSAMTLPLYKNLLESSRASVLVAIDPLGAYLFALRSRFGHGATLTARTALAAPRRGTPTAAATDAVIVAWHADAWRGADDTDGGGLAAERQAAIVVAEMAAAGSGVVHHADFLRAGPK